MNGGGVPGYSDDHDDPSPIKPGYHGNMIGIPSSLNYQGKLGVAFNDFIANV